MTHLLLPTNTAIADLFAHQIIDLGGKITNRYEACDRLIMRSVLPQQLEVQPGDSIYGGVALRTHHDRVYVHPYLFRDVCRNGAIAAWATQNTCVQRLEGDVAADAEQTVLADLAVAIEVCADQEHLLESVDRMRAASGASLNDPRNLLLTMLTQTQETKLDRYIALISEQIEREDEPTHYAFMNAITAVARDVQDPDDKWRLEELGGGVLAAVEPKPRLDIALMV